MKTLAKLLLSIACVALLTNCQKDPIPLGVYNSDQTQLFTADFIVWDFSGVDNKSSIERIEGCTRTWMGEGNSTILGEFTVEMTFPCFIPSGETCGNFCDLTGKIIALPSGDELYFSIPEGRIACNTDFNCDEFQTCFNDEALIVGGTGRFLKASGSFWPHAYIHNGDQNNWFANFKSEGKIRLNMIYSTSANDSDPNENPAP